MYIYFLFCLITFDVLCVCFFLCFALQVDPQNFPQGQVVGLLLWLVGMRLFHFAMCCRDPGFGKFDRMRALSAGPLFLISFRCVVIHKIMICQL